MKFFLCWILLCASCLPAQALDLMQVAVRPAPYLSVPLALGGRSTLAKLHGRVVLVNFWASWCPLCLVEMPAMNRLALAMNRRPFVLLAVNAGEPPGWVLGFIKKTRPSVAVGLDPSATYMHAWGAVVLPTSYLVDKAGRIRYTLVGPVEWDAPEMIAIINKLMTE
jgi:thiol-disulfide isomerase/thioredoxin